MLHSSHCSHQQKQHFLRSGHSRNVRSPGWDSTGSFLAQVEHPTADTFSSTSSSRHFSHYGYSTVLASVRDEGAQISARRLINRQAAAAWWTPKRGLRSQGAFPQHGCFGQVPETSLDLGFLICTQTVTTALILLGRLGRSNEAALPTLFRSCWVEEAGKARWWLSSRAQRKGRGERHGSLEGVGGHQGCLSSRRGLQKRQE